MFDEYPHVYENPLAHKDVAGKHLLSDVVVKLVVCIIPFSPRMMAVSKKDNRALTEFDDIRR